MCHRCARLVLAVVSYIYNPIFVLSLFAVLFFILDHPAPTVSIRSAEPSKLYISRELYAAAVPRTAFRTQQYVRMYMVFFIQDEVILLVFIPGNVDTSYPRSALQSCFRDTLLGI